MLENWKAYKLGEFSKNVSRRFDFNKHQKVVFINTGDVLEGKFLHNDIIESKGLPGQAKKAIIKGDILFSEIRPKNKRYAYVDIDVPNHVVSTKFMVIVSDDSIINRKFFLQLLTSDDRLNELQNIAEGRSGTFPQITFEAISEIEFYLPPLPEQRAIATIISAIDDKIELNLQMNKTLEEMAMTLYKHWFVDFGPFQDGEFVDSELGMIPKGWEVKLLQELGKMFYGQMPKKELIVEEGYPIYSGYRNVGYYPNYNCDKGKVIVVARGVGGTGDIKLTSERCFLTNLSICFGNDIGLIEDSLLFFGLKRYGLDHLRTGSAQPQITINDLNRVEILVPPKDIQSQFLQIFSSLLDEMESHSIENQTLTTLRDTLLPKLISGEIRVNEKEKIMEEVS